MELKLRPEASIVSPNERKIEAFGAKPDLHGG